MARRARPRCMRVFCVLVPGGGGPPARPARSARPLGPPARPACLPSAELVFSCLSACWCLGAAARPLAVRAASFARRVVSKPGQALPPPPGTIAKPCGSFGVLHSGSSVFLLVTDGAAHPISRHCTLSDRVQCSLTGAMLPNGCMASHLVLAWGGSCVGENRQLSRAHRSRHGLVTGSDAPRAVFAVSA